MASTSLRAVNARLMQAERQLTDDAGLPKRPWYRHLLYAPGYYTGYAVKTMPGVREAIEQKQYAEAETEIGRVAKALERESEQSAGLRSEQRPEQRALVDKSSDDECVHRQTRRAGHQRSDQDGSQAVALAFDSARSHDGWNRAGISRE